MGALVDSGHDGLLLLLTDSSVPAIAFAILEAISEWKNRTEERGIVI